jgi:hypothetical protein
VSLFRINWFPVISSDFVRLFITFPNQLIEFFLIFIKSFKWLGSAAALESLHFHVIIFPKLYLDLINMESDESAKTFVENLCTTSYFRDYISLTLTQERLFLNNELTYELLKHYLPKVFIDFVFLISYFDFRIIYSIKSFLYVFRFTKVF